MILPVPDVRVLMFHTTLPLPGRKPGGVEVAVHRLATALTDLGVSVTVASLSAAPPDSRYGHRLLFGGNAWLRDSRVGRLLVIPLLLNTVNAAEAHVIHYHGDDWFTLRRGRATVRTLHGSALREAQQATTWRRRALQYFLYPLERMSARLASVAVGVGRDTAAIHGLAHVIGNGVDAAVFSPGQKSNTPVILYVGTWEGRKRGRWMYEQFVSAIAPRHETVLLEFVCDEEPPPHPRVAYSRFPTDSVLAKAFREAWVFALPSAYEGFGIPYVEALASGTAIVATPNAGAQEVLGDGRFGVLASDDAFADQILLLLQDDERRNSLADAGIARARDYSWARIAGEYLAVYGEAVALHAHRSGVD